MKRITLFIFSILLGTICFAQRADNYKPDNPNVVLKQTNLPIILINTGNTMILKDTRIAARMTVINNGDGKLNYADTLAYPNQKIDYKGRIGIKYRGNSSFTSSAKKPYSFRPENELGEKQKAALLGMNADNDWCLLAPYSDKSLIRDILVFKLAKPYFEYVPTGVHCELILDDTYYGVYVLSERVIKGNNRLNLSKPGKTGDELTGGYHLEVDRNDETVYTSKYPPENSAGAVFTGRTISFQYKYPEYEDLIREHKTYIRARIDAFENSLKSYNYTDLATGYRQYLDITSFIDYMLSTEFARNVDGYRLSTNLYKYRDSVDPRFKMSLWDFNLGFGNANYNDGWNTQSWAYNLNDVAPDESLLVPFWWNRLLKDPSYVKEMKKRWTMYRKTNYTETNIMHVIDSLTTNLNKENAQYRNSLAWPRWGVYVWPNSYVANSYEDEIAFIKDWIKQRLVFMDGALYTDAEAPQINPISVYPNPVPRNGILKITGENIRTIKLVNLQGIQFLQRNAPDNELSVNGIPPGYYVIIVETSKGRYTNKILIR